MRIRIGLVMLSACISLSWADEFKLSFSQDIVNSADGQPSELDDLPVKKAAEIPSSPLPIPLPAAAPVESPAAPKEAVSENEPARPALSEKSASRAYPATVKPAESNNRFLPIQNPTLTTLPWPGVGNDNSAWGQVWRDNQHAPTGSDAFDQLNEEIRALIGEDMYAEMVWTYQDAKQLESWLVATIDQSGLFARDSLIVGLNDQLMARLTSWGLMESDSHAISSLGRIDSQRGMEEDSPAAAKPALDPELMKQTFEGQSSFFRIVKYLTISNFMYAVLTMIMLIYAGKGIRFFVRQR